MIVDHARFKLMKQKITLLVVLVVVALGVGLFVGVQPPTLENQSEVSTPGTTAPTELQPHDLGAHFFVPDSFSKEPYYNGNESSATGFDQVSASWSVRNATSSLALTVERELVQGHSCNLDFCDAPAKETISANGISWEFLGPQTYCDVGQCSPEMFVYRTVHNESRYYVWSHDAALARSVLDSFVFEQ